MLSNLSLNGTDFLQYLVDLTMRTSILVVLAIIISRLFRQAPAQFHYVMWMVVMLQFLIPIRIQSGFTPAVIIPTISVNFPAVDLASTANSGGHNWHYFLLRGWLLGAVAVFSLNLFRQAAFLAVLKKARPMKRTSPLKNIPVFVNARIPRAFAFGLRRPAIYLPEDAEDWTAAELQFILQHELAHIQRRDLLWLPLQNLLRCFFLFHPLMWLCNHMVNFYRELACDSAAIQRTGGQSVDYSQTLLNHLTRSNSFQLASYPSNAFGMHKSFFIWRLKYLLNQKEHKMQKISWWQKGLIAAMVLLTVAVACNKGVEKAPRPDGKIELTFSGEAAMKNIEGDCVIEVAVAETGEITNVIVIESLSPAIDSTAIAAVKSVKWLPAEKDGQAIAGTARIPFKFKFEHKIIEGDEADEVNINVEVHTSLDTDGDKEIRTEIKKEIRTKHEDHDGEKHEAHD
ncbi:M56 family metallopeptidase, partial [bacterium]|nr:M56 family metallopeptidase [bacterium]